MAAFVPGYVEDFEDLEDFEPEGLACDNLKRKGELELKEREEAERRVKEREEEEKRAKEK